MFTGRYTNVTIIEEKNREKGTVAVVPKNPRIRAQMERERREYNGELEEQPSKFPVNQSRKTMDTSGLYPPRLNRIAELKKRLSEVKHYEAKIKQSGNNLNAAYDVQSVSVFQLN